MEKAIEVYQTNPLAWVLTLGVLVAVYFYHCWKENEFQWWNLIPRRRGRAMRRARREWVKAHAVDDFVERVEERYYQGIYTDGERKELYRDFKKCFPIRDVFPSAELLKEAIQKRRNMHIHDPVRLPDGKEKARPKHMFEKLVKA